MAGPSSQILKGFEVSKHYYTSIPIIRIRAGVTIAVGDVLEEASGLAALADSGDTATIIGVAASAGASGGYVNVIPAWNGIIWEATLDGDTNTGIALAEAQLMQQYDLGIDAGNGKPYVDQESTGSTILTVVGLKDAVGTTYGRVLVSFMQNKTVWGA